MSETVPLLILPPRATEDSQSIWRACVRRGWSSERLQGWRVPDALLETTREILIYGELLFAEAVCDQLGLALLEPSVDWLTTLPAEYLQRKVTLHDLETARGFADPVFVKPAEGKTFEARVYQTGSELPGEDTVDGITPVLCSEIVNIQLEVRCFVKNRKLTTISPYWRNGGSAEGDGSYPFLADEEVQATTFIQRILDDPRAALPPGVVVDIGRLRHGNWLVIEANPCWGAGVYGCDANAILDVIRVSVIKRAEHTEAQLRWINARA